MATVVWRTCPTSSGVDSRLTGGGSRRGFTAHPDRTLSQEVTENFTETETFSTSEDSLKKRKMADSVEHEVSSTTPLFSEDVHHYQAEPDSEQDQPKPDLFSADDIVDLVGGAQDALNRHFAEDSAPHESTETSFSPPEEPVTLLDPEPVSVPEPEPEPEPEVETASPDSTSFSFVPETASFAEEPKVVAPEAEPESTKIVPEPEAAPEPEPAPESDALPVAEPRKAAPAPAEAAEQPAVTEEAPAPASCEYLHRTGPVHYSSTEF